MSQTLLQQGTARPAERENPRIDYKRVLYQALRHWYWVLLSLSVAVGIAYVKNRYAKPVYPVTASILIKEEKETNGAELLYTNKLIDQYRNYYNEIYILRSIPLVQSVIEDNNFGVSIYKEGEVLTSEIYPFPVDIRMLNPKQVTNARFDLTVVDNHTYELTNKFAVPVRKQRFRFGDSALFEGVKVRMTVRDTAALATQLGREVVFTYSDPSQLTGEFVGKLSARWAEKNSGVLIISSTGVNPLKEMDFVRGVIARYERYDLDNKNEIAARTVAFINSQLREINDSLSQVEHTLQRFKQSHAVAEDLAGETTRIYEQMQKYDQERSQWILRDNYCKYLIQYVQSAQPLDQSILPTTVGFADPVLSQLVNDMAKTQMELKLFTGTSNRENPVIQRKERELKEIRSAIVEAATNQLKADQMQLESSSSQIRILERQLSALPETERAYVAIKRNYSLLENLYVYLLEKRSEASISRASNVSDIIMVDPPMPGGPITAQPFQVYLYAVIIGLGIPFGILLMFELLNTKLQSKEDLDRITSVPFIGGVGHKRTGDNRIVASSPKSAIAESFRALRSNLTYFLGERKTPIILVTSSISGEGKTFTTINVATVIALSGKRTLIVGADLRRPKIFADFGLGNEVGLSTYLAGMHSFEEVLQKTQEPNLLLVSGGPVPPNPSELILSGRMKQFLDEARTQFDFILIDSPPLAIVADAFVLSEMVDHMLFIVRQNYTPSGMLKTLDEYYRTGRLKNISIVLNDIYRSGPGYGYGYGYHYGYGSTYGYGRKKNGGGYYSES